MPRWRSSTGTWPVDLERARRDIGRRAGAHLLLRDRLGLAAALDLALLGVGLLAGDARGTAPRSPAARWSRRELLQHAFGARAALGDLALDERDGKQDGEGDGGDGEAAKEQGRGFIGSSCGIGPTTSMPRECGEGGERTGRNSDSRRPRARSRSRPMAREPNSARPTTSRSSIAPKALALALGCALASHAFAQAPCGPTSPSDMSHQTMTP